jgi:hypothetical protein
MYLSTIVVATIAAVAPLASAHGAGIPQIIGLDVADLKARNLLNNLGARFVETGNARNKLTLEARQDKPECGPGIGSCGAGLCCSRSGCMISGDYS